MNGSITLERLDEAVENARGDSITDLNYEVFQILKTSHIFLEDIVAKFNYTDIVKAKSLVSECRRKIRGIIIEKLNHKKDNLTEFEKYLIERIELAQINGHLRNTYDHDRKDDVLFQATDGSRKSLDEYKVLVRLMEERFFENYG